LARTTGSSYAYEHTLIFHRTTGAFYTCGLSNTFQRLNFSTLLVLTGNFDWLH